MARPCKSGTRLHVTLDDRTAAFLAAVLPGRPAGEQIERLVDGAQGRAVIKTWVSPLVKSIDALSDRIDRHDAKIEQQAAQIETLKSALQTLVVELTKATTANNQYSYDVKKITDSLQANWSALAYAVNQDHVSVNSVALIVDTLRTEINESTKSQAEQLKSTLYRLLGVDTKTSSPRS